MPKTKRQTKTPTTPAPIPPLVLSRDEYKVDGGRIQDDGACSIDLIGKKITATWRRAVTLQMRRGELEFYPIGAKIRVTVERLK